MEKWQPNTEVPNYLSNLFLHFVQQYSATVFLFCILLSSKWMTTTKNNNQSHQKRLGSLHYICLIATHNTIPFPHFILFQNRNDMSQKCVLDYHFSMVNIEKKQEIIKQWFRLKLTDHLTSLSGKITHANGTTLVY